MIHFARNVVARSNAAARRAGAHVAIIDVANTTGHQLWTAEHARVIVRLLPRPSGAR